MLQGRGGMGEGFTATATSRPDDHPEAAVSTTRFILIRHAQSTWNVAGRWQGHGDPPLSDVGLAQAERCAQRLAEMDLDADLLVCSDLLRTRQTAEPIANALDLEAIPSAALRELDVGEWTGLTRDEIEARDPDLLAAFESADPNVRPGGGETRNEIRVRVRRVVERLGREHPGQCIVMVVHAGVIRALVPEADPGNTEIVEVNLADIREARQDIGSQIGKIV